MNKTVKAIAVTLLSALLLTGCGVNPPYGDYDCVGKDAGEVETAFKDAGFSSVKVEESETKDKEKDGTVCRVKIDGWASFKDNSACNGKEEVTITKYVLKEAEAPKAEKKQKEEKAEDEKKEEDTKSFGDVYMMIGTAMSMAFGENYDMSYDESGITVNMWQDGLAALAAMAKNGDAEAQAEWDNTVESVKDMTVQTKRSTMEKYGYGDKILVVNVLNDVSQENTILTVSDGVVFYDAVNGIDLLGVE